jgi:hypothetical protein
LAFFLILRGPVNSTAFLNPNLSYEAQSMFSCVVVRFGAWLMMQASFTGDEWPLAALVFSIIFMPEGARRISHMQALHLNPIPCKS